MINCLLLIFFVKLICNKASGECITAKRCFYPPNRIHLTVSCFAFLLSSSFKRTVCNKTPQKYLCYEPAQAIYDRWLPTLNNVKEADER